MRESKQLTRRQQQILDFVRRSVHVHGYPPTVREIARRVGLASPSTVQYHLDALGRLGYLQRVPGHPRALQVAHSPASSTPVASVEPPGAPASVLRPQRVASIELPVGASDEGEQASVPLVGRIAAGAPITAEQHVEDVVTLPARFTGRGQLFMLEVHGDSMVDAAICDGDFVVVRAQPEAEDGEIVAAMLEGEATVKVLSREDGHVRLLPRNPAYAPIPADDAVILGKVVTVIRSL